jgi:hypothetical protein
LQADFCHCLPFKGCQRGSYVHSIQRQPDNWIFSFQATIAQCTTTCDLCNR